MRIWLNDDRLFELLVAVILRNNGYIAGVPRRLLGGRATKHQVNVIAIDINNSPFTLNNIIVVRASCDHQSRSDLELVTGLKSTVTDLEQTLPPKRELIRNVVGTDRGDLFHRIYGRQKPREKFTVNYIGCVFISKFLNQSAWEYANANGIYIIYLPHTIAGHDLKYWFNLLKEHLKLIFDDQGAVTLPGLIKKEKKHAAFQEIIQLLQDEKTALQLHPEQTHDLFTIINEILKQKEFAALQNKLQQLVLASMNGYPVVIDHNLTYHNLLEAALISLSGHFKRARIVSQHTKYRPLNTVKFIVSEAELSGDPNVAVLNYQTDIESVPQPIKTLSGKLYVPVTALNRRMNRFQLKLPLKAGISLIGEFHLTDHARKKQCTFKQHP